MTEARYSIFPNLLAKKNIKWNEFDGGDQKAGSIQVISRATKNDDVTHYQININCNHPQAVKFTTLVHELGHLFFGHLGPDKKLKVPKRASGARS